MEVSQRRKVVGNVEDLKPTQSSNGPANGLARRQDFPHSDRKLNGRNISSVAKRYFKIVSYPIECLVCAIAIFYLILFLSPVLIVFNVLKFIEKQWVFFKSGCAAMSGQDALWLQDNEENRMYINSSMVVECLNIEHLVNAVRECLLRSIALKNEKGQQRFPRFSKCIHPGIFQYFLKEAEDFDISQHVYAYEGPVPESHEGMEALISTLSAKNITFDKPPWQFIIIPKTYDGNEAVVLFRMHHGLADGVSLTRFLLEQFPDESLTNNQLVKFSSVDRKWMLLNALLSGAKIIIEKLISRPDNSIIHGPMPGGVKKMSWSKPINLQTVKKIKNATGTTVNDVLMACVSMSFHDYFKTHGVSSPPDVTASVPVDTRVRGKPIKLENNFAIVSLKLPASKDDPLQNLYETKIHMDHIKHSGEAFAISIGGSMSVEYMPDCINNLWNVPIANKHSCVLSNVPGPQQIFSISGHKVKQMFFAPPQRDLVGIGIGLVSYAGEFTIGVCCDLNCMKDPQHIVKAFESRLEQLEKCVTSKNGQTEFDSGIE